MQKGGIGGANTKTGLFFEGKVDFLTFIKSQKDYSVKGNTVFYKNKKVALSFKKYGLYTYLGENGIDYTKIISKRLLPDDAIFVIVNNTLFILEIKFQNLNKSKYEDLVMFCKKHDSRVVDKFKNYLMFSVKDEEGREDLLKYFKRQDLIFKELGFREPNLDEISLKVIEK